MELLKWLRIQWDRVSAWVLVGAGLLVLLLGWLGVSNTPYVAEQIPYVVSGGVFALFLLGLGAVLWLSADLRDEWRKLDRLEQRLMRSGHEPAPESGDSASRGGDGAATGPAPAGDGIAASEGGLQAVGNGDRPARHAATPAEWGLRSASADVAVAAPGGLWGQADVLRLYATNALGAVTLLVAWWGISASPEVATHVTWLNVAAAGAVVAATGNAVWLLTGRRAVGQRMRRLQPLVAPVDASASSQETDAGGAVSLLAVSAGTRYHQPGCHLVSGKPHVEPASEEEHTAAGRTPCGVCRP